MILFIFHPNIHICVYKINLLSIDYIIDKMACKVRNYLNMNVKQHKKIYKNAILSISMTVMIQSYGIIITFCVFLYDEEIFK